MNMGRRIGAISVVLALALAAVPASGGERSGTITLY